MTPALTAADRAAARAVAAAAPPLSAEIRERLAAIIRGTEPTCSTSADAERSAPAA